MIETKESQSVSEMVDSLLQTANSLLDTAIILAKIHDVPLEERDVLRLLVEGIKQKENYTWIPYHPTITGTTITTNLSATTTTSSVASGNDNYYFQI